MSKVTYHRSLQPSFRKQVKDFFVDQLGISVKRFLPLGENVYTDLDRSLGLKNIKTVFDIGANVGQSAVQYRKYFKNATVYSFEPGIATFQQLKENVGAFPEVRLFNVGFGNMEAIMEMRMQHKSSLNSLKTERNKGEGKVEHVQIRRLDDFLKEETVSSIDFMKIDTEGFEREVLDGASETLASGKIKAIQLELGFNRRDFRTTHFNQVNDLLQDFDFAVAGFYDQSPNKPGWNFLKLSNVLYLNQRLWK